MAQTIPDKYNYAYEGKKKLWNVMNKLITISGSNVASCLGSGKTYDNTTIVDLMNAWCDRISWLMGASYSFNGSTVSESAYCNVEQSDRWKTKSRWNDQNEITVKSTSGYPNWLNVWFTDANNTMVATWPQTSGQGCDHTAVSYSSSWNSYAVSINQWHQNTNVGRTTASSIYVRILIRNTKACKTSLLSVGGSTGTIQRKLDYLFVQKVYAYRMVRSLGQIGYTLPAFASCTWANLAQAMAYTPVWYPFGQVTIQYDSATYSQSGVSGVSVASSGNRDVYDTAQTWSYSSTGWLDIGVRMNTNNASTVPFYRWSGMSTGVVSTNFSDGTGNDGYWREMQLGARINPTVYNGLY